MSADYVGSSDSFSGASSSGKSGGSSALTQSILQSVVTAGENVALANVNPALATPVGARPVSNPIAVSSINRSGTSSIFVVIILAVVAIFAFKEL